MLYLLLSGALCYFYYKKIVVAADFSSPNSILSVQSFETVKPYQFRLLVPLIFMLFKPLTFIPEKIIFIIYNVVIVYFIVIVYHKFLSEYFQNRKAILFLAPAILYPILWNYVILNQSFQFYDFTAILIFTLGLYFIVKENFKFLLIVFIVGLINKETIIYLLFAYLLFNYKIIFTKKIILNSLFLSALFLGYKLFLGYVFRNNPGDPFEIGFAVNMKILEDLPHNRIYQKNLMLNFGAIYIFVLLLFITGRWKKFPDRRKTYMNLAFIPYILLGVYITYFTEVRVYTELIPMVTTLFIIYLSTFKKFNIQPITANGKG